jgi:hypothetical protein
MRTLLLICVLAAVSSTGIGQWTRQGPKLVGSGGWGIDQGRSVALSADGNTAIVASGTIPPGNSPPISGAFVYTRSNGVWTQQGPELVGLGCDTSYECEVALSADGNTAAVCAPSRHGDAWVFTRSNGVWTQQGNALVCGGTQRESYSVALSGDGNTLIVGCFRFDRIPYGEPSPGAVWFFARSNGVWRQQGGVFVGEGDDNRGYCVALSGDGNVALVGEARYIDRRAEQIQGAWVYTRSNGVWSQRGNRLVGAGPDYAWWWFGRGGCTVALSENGKTAILGNPWSRAAAGVAHIFTEKDGVWNQEGGDLIGAGAVGLRELQGFSVGLSADGNTAIVGGRGDNNYAGAGWIFARTNEGWKQQGAKLEPDNPGDSPQLGWSVALSGDGNTALLGAKVDNRTEDAQGYTYSAGSASIFVRKGLFLKDGRKRFLPELEFNLYRIESGPPEFKEVWLGKFKTDATGQIPIMYVGADSYELGNVTLHNGDILKFSRWVGSIPCGKHGYLTEAAANIFLDNAKFDEFGTMSFETLDDKPFREIVLDHSEFRYNLVVSIEWDAEKEYLNGVEQGFRNLSNYLYDVSDGQIRLDTVWVFDDHVHWEDADLQVHSHNDEEPITLNYSGRSRLNFGNPECTMWLPRKWFGNLDDTRNSSYLEHPLQMDAPVDYRTKGHEFGHYGLGFCDEYKFYDGLGKYVKEPSYRHNPGSNYGFMDSQYGKDEPFASEMSSSASYVNISVRNTEQYGVYRQSCWDFLESEFEREYGDPPMFVPICKPEERSKLPQGLTYLQGPNDGTKLDYDVGALVQFPVRQSDPSSRTLNMEVSDADGTVLPRMDVVVLRPLLVGGELRLEQGQTSDAGKIYVLGYNFGERILVSGRYRIILDPGVPFSSAYQESWLCGEITLSGPGRAGKSVAEYSFSGDSVRIHLRPVAGDYPLLCGITLSDNSATYRLRRAKLFSSDPTIELCTENGSKSSSTFFELQGSYGSAALRNLGSSGTFTISAVDDSARVFFINTPYTVHQADSSSSCWKINGPDGLSEVFIDSANGPVRRGMILSTSYPIIRTGLDKEAIHVGETQTVSFYPDVSLRGRCSITIHYEDNDLGAGSGIRGDESSIQIFRWNDAKESWELVGGDVDTSNDLVRALITGAGVYGAFSTRLVQIGEATRSYDVSASWNLASVPLQVADPRSTVLYPTAKSPALAYHGEYAAEDTLRTGSGYWLKFSEAQTIAMKGFPLVCETVQLTPGWNLIGSIAATVPISNIASLPPGMTVSPFFKYSAGYAIASSIEPGLGYWVKSDRIGALILDSRGSSGSALNIVSTGELPPEPPSLTSTEDSRMPTEYTLDQNYPNPFNPATTIRYALPRRSTVYLAVFSTLGQQVSILQNGDQDAGYHEVRFDGSHLPSGVYFYRMQAGSFTETKKFLLVR